MIKELKVNKSSRTPLYIQVERSLRKIINNNKLDQLKKPLTEEYLEKEFKVSRNTIRQAISILVEDGILVRRRSKGISLVDNNSKILKERSTGLSFTDYAIRNGQTPSAKLLIAEEIHPPGSMLDILDMDSNEMIFHCRRLRCINNIPVCITDFYIPLALAPGISGKDFSKNGPNQSIHYILEKLYNIKINLSLETVKAISIKKQEAELLKIQAGSPVLLRTNIIYSEESEVIGFDEMIMTRDFKLVGRVLKEK